MNCPRCGAPNVRVQDGRWTCHMCSRSGSVGDPAVEPPPPLPEPTAEEADEDEAMQLKTTSPPGPEPASVRLTCSLCGKPIKGTGQYPLCQRDATLFACYRRKHPGTQLDAWIAVVNAEVDRELAVPQGAPSKTKFTFKVPDNTDICGSLVITDPPKTNPLDLMANVDEDLSALRRHFRTVQKNPERFGVLCAMRSITRRMAEQVNGLIEYERTFGRDSA